MPVSLHLPDAPPSAPIIDTNVPHGLDLVSAFVSLTPRDHHVLSYLQSHRVLTAAQLARLLFASPGAARQRLVVLHRRGVLARFRREVSPGSQAWRYTVGPVGAAIHAARTNGPIPKPALTAAKTFRLAHSAHTDHLVGVNDFFTTLAGAARTHPGSALRAWFPESITAEACGGIVRPDGYGEYQDARREVGFFLEYDRGTEPLDVVATKIAKYAGLARAGIPTYPVLIYLPSPTRERHVHRAITARHGDQRTVPVATTTPTLAPLGDDPAVTVRPVWQPTDRPHRVTLTELGTPRTT